MKAQKVLKGLVFLMIGLFVFASCAKEEVVVPTYDKTTYEEQLVYINEDENESLIWGSVYDAGGNSINKGGIVYLLNNNETIDMYVTTDGEFKFENKDYKGYEIEININGYTSLLKENIFPQNEKISFTLN